MGALQSKIDNITGSQAAKPAGSQATGTQSNPNWQAVAAHAFEKPKDSEAIILFTRDAVTNPCDLVGKSVIELANDMARKNGVFAFAVGQGPCPECTAPTLYWWNGREWQHNVLADVSSVLRAVDGYVLKHNLNTIYHVYGDKDLKITSVLRSAKASNGDVVIGDGCSKKNLAETINSNAVFWIILILLIILILWLLFRSKGPAV